MFMHSGDVYSNQELSNKTARSCRSSLWSAKFCKKFLLDSENEKEYSNTLH